MAKATWQHWSVVREPEDLPAGLVRVCVQHHTHKRPDLFNAGRASTARRAWDLATLSVHHIQGQKHTPAGRGGGTIELHVY